ncbi:penicillin-binding protein [Erysipelotrichaceae bacterium Oil+RF-744-GAM-WT-6]|uniref:Penicillin-binding protein n=1 Tax=Stecheria intestinalis TaxID=2606630 RepID=A0A7X2TF24_9FIRM|nr:penicillin-binding protein [Stecheria intestinalis]MSS57303.1 penicillin-binding protein [Stecheria intestinalis]
MKKNRGDRAVRSIFLLALAVMILLAADVFFVAIEKKHLRSGTDLSAYADSDNLRTEVTKAMRGNIYASDGTVIAEDSRTYNIICILDSSRPSVGDTISYVQDKEGTAEQLSKILKIDYDTCLNYLNQDVYQTELGTAGRNLSESVKDEIEALNLPGIEFTNSIKRVYPLGQFASNLIGFAQSDENGSVVGKMGAELYLNSYLTGTDGYRTYQADKNGYILPGMKEDTQAAVNGNDVYTTLNVSIQQALEDSFQMTEDTFGAIRIWGAVMEISTGKILAWGQYPSFDPNTLDITDYNNYGSQLPYEPGSTLKGITWSAAINEGVYNGEDTLYSGPFYYDWDENRNPYRVDYHKDFVITNASGNNWGWITYDQGLMLSSNVAAATIETSLITPDILLEYEKKFGFFQPVRSDGMPEESGYLQFTWPGDKISLSYGQGSTVTMLQMLQAYSAIFGDGTMKRPYYIESIRDGYDSNKVLYQASTKVTGTPITEDTAKQMQALLYQVVNNDTYGTAKYYKIDETEIIGKTGTTQVASNGNYLSGYTIASLMSAMPADNPQVLVYYCFEAPYNHDAHYKTDAVKNLLSRTAIELGFASNTSAGSSSESSAGDGDAVLVSGTMPNLVNHSLSYADEKLNGLDITLYTLGNGDSVIAQYPEEGESLSNGERVFLVTDTNSFTMPDLTGWTRKDVAALWQVTQFGFRLKGEGVVTSQNIAAGTTVTKGTEIEVEFG